MGIANDPPPPPGTGDPQAVTIENVLQHVTIPPGDEFPNGSYILTQTEPNLWINDSFEDLGISVAKSGDEFTVQAFFQGAAAFYSQHLAAPSFSQPNIYTFYDPTRFYSGTATILFSTILQKLTYDMHMYPIVEALGEYLPGGVVRVVDNRNKTNFKAKLTGA